MGFGCILLEVLSGVTRWQLERSIGGATPMREAMIEDAAGLARVQVDCYRTACVGILPEWIAQNLGPVPEESAG